MTDTIEIRRYVDARGQDVFGSWLARLGDLRTRAKIGVRIARLAAGNFGDCRSLGQGLCELRIDWGPGYRVYYAQVGIRSVLLLCGGSKGTQSKDIERAHAYIEDYKIRAKQSEG